VAGEIFEAFTALTHKQESVTISSETPDYSPYSKIKKC